MYRRRPQGPCAVCHLLACGVLFGLLYPLIRSHLVTQALYAESLWHLLVVPAPPRCGLATFKLPQQPFG